MLLNFVKGANYDLQINEIMFDPEGNDSGYEWIEVINQSNKVFAIKTGRNGWRFNDGANHLFNDPSISVTPNEIFIIVQDKNKFLERYPSVNTKIIEANFTLKNDQGVIKIFDENKNLLSSAEYNNKCGGSNNGYSIVIQNNNCFENKVKNGTPGSLTVNFSESYSDNKQNQSNFLKTSSSNITSNQSSSSQTSFQTENSSFVDNRKIADNYSSVLANNTHSLTSTFNLNTDKNLNKNNLLDNQQLLVTNDYLTDLNLVISEFLPDPDGNDKGKEFIELYNEGNNIIDFNKLNIYLVINNKKINLNGKILPRSYFVISNQTNNFAIRNNGETIKLYFNNEVIFSISYSGKAQKGKSLSRLGDNQWLFTLPTPGRPNIFTAMREESFIVDDNLKNSYVEANISQNEIKPTKNNLNSFTSSFQQANLLNIDSSLNFLLLVSAIILIIVLSIIVFKYL